jgi:hypothetical protein
MLFVCGTDWRTSDAEGGSLALLPRRAKTCEGPDLKSWESRCDGGPEVREARGNVKQGGVVCSCVAWVRDERRGASIERYELS